MYLQFSSGPKKLNSYSSMPQFKVDRQLNNPPGANTDTPPRPLPFLNVNPASNPLSQSDGKKQQPPTLSFCYTDRLRTQELTDDLINFRQGLRQEASNPQLTERHTKHKILNRHLNRPGMQSAIKQDGRSSNRYSSQIQRVQTELDQRYTQPYKPYLAGQDQPIPYLSNSRKDLKQQPLVSMPTASTLGRTQYENHRFSDGDWTRMVSASPSPEKEKQIKTEIAKLHEDIKKQQDQAKRLQNQEAKMEELERRFQLDLIRKEEEARRLQADETRRLQDQEIKRLVENRRLQEELAKKQEEERKAQQKLVQKQEEAMRLLEELNRKEEYERKSHQELIRKQEEAKRLQMVLTKRQEDQRRAQEELIFKQEEAKMLQQQLIKRQQHEQLSQIQLAKREKEAKKLQQELVRKQQQQRKSQQELLKNKGQAKRLEQQLLRKQRQIEILRQQQQKRLQLANRLQQQEENKQHLIKRLSEQESISSQSRLRLVQEESQKQELVKRLSQESAKRQEDKRHYHLQSTKWKECEYKLQQEMKEKQGQFRRFFEEQSKKFEQAKMQLNEEIKKFQNENRRQQDEIYRNQQEIKRHHAEISRLEQQVQRYKEWLSDQQNGRKKQKQQTVSIQQSLSQFKNQNQSLKQQTQFLNRSLVFLTDEQKLTKQRLAKVQAELAEAASIEAESRQIKKKLVGFQIELEEKDSEIKFLTDKLLAEKHDQNLKIDITRYEQVISNLQKQIQLLANADRVVQSKPNNEFNQILKESISQTQKLKDQISFKDEQIQLLKDEIHAQKRKIDDFHNETQTLKLYHMTAQKNIKVQFDIQNQMKFNQIASLRKVIVVLQEKLKIAVNDNVRKDQFVKNHILGKTKNQYDRADIETFFWHYHAEVPKESLAKLLRRQLDQIKQQQQKIEELEGLLAVLKVPTQMDTTQSGDK